MLSPLGLPRVEARRYAEGRPKEQQSPEEMEKEETLEMWSPGSSYA